MRSFSCRILRDPQMSVLYILKFYFIVIFSPFHIFKMFTLMIGIGTHQPFCVRFIASKDFVNLWSRISVCCKCMTSMKIEKRMNFYTRIIDCKLQSWIRYLRVLFGYWIFLEQKHGRCMPSFVASTSFYDAGPKHYLNCCKRKSLRTVI